MHQNAMQKHSKVDVLKAQKVTVIKSNQKLFYVHSIFVFKIDPKFSVERRNCNIYGYSLPISSHFFK